MTFKYDEKGKIVERSKIKSDGTVEHKLSFIYDDKENKIEEDRFNSKDSLNYKWTFKYQYDSQNNWVKRIDYNGTTPEFISEKVIEYYQ